MTPTRDQLLGALEELLGSLDAHNRAGDAARALLEAARRAAPAADTTMARAVIWLLGNDTGRSSTTMLAAMLGFHYERPMPPFDDADLGQCRRLLALFPEWRERLLELTRRQADWAPWVKRLQEPQPAPPAAPAGPCAIVGCDAPWTVAGLCAFHALKNPPRESLTPWKCEGCGEPAGHTTADDVHLCSRCFAAAAKDTQPAPLDPQAWLIQATNRVLEIVAELPDRSSPDDWPEAMLLTGSELREIVTTQFEPIVAALTTERARAEAAERGIKAMRDTNEVVARCAQEHMQAGVDLRAQLAAVTKERDEAREWARQSEECMAQAAEERDAARREKHAHAAKLARDIANRIGSAVVPTHGTTAMTKAWQIANAAAEQAEGVAAREATP